MEASERAAGEPGMSLGMKGADRPSPLCFGAAM